MIKILLYFIIISAVEVSAKMIISPLEAMRQSFNSTKIDKEEYKLTDMQIKNIKESAKVKLKKKAITLFKATKNDKIIGYGILINRKVRSKNAAVLYMISSDSILKSIEVIAFNEPMEYIPSNTWMSQFQNRQTDNMLILSKEIPTITGATMSARNIVDGSRVAFAFYNEVLKGR